MCSCVPCHSPDFLLADAHGELLEVILEMGTVGVDHGSYKSAALSGQSNQLTTLVDTTRSHALFLYCYASYGELDRLACCCYE